MSLSQEMSCWISDTPFLFSQFILNMTTYLKDGRSMNTVVTSFHFHGQRHGFPWCWKVYWEMSRCVHNVLQNFQMVPKVNALSQSYLYFWDTLDYWHCSCPNCVMVVVKYMFRILIWYLQELTKTNKYEIA